MPKRAVTQGDRDRAYHLSLYAISEENRLGLLTKEQLSARMKEAWETCYGDATPRKGRAESATTD